MSDYKPLDLINSFEKNMLDVRNASGKQTNFNWADKESIYALTKEMLIDFGKFVNTPTKLTEADFPDTVEEFVKYVLSDDFLRKDFFGKYQKFNTLMLELTPTMLQLTGYKIEDFYNNPLMDIRTEMRDLIIQLIILQRWAVNKQVLKPDRTFTHHLIQTDKLVINKDMLDHAPFNTFYIDVSDCPEFNNIHGVFVFITKINKTEYSFLHYILPMTENRVFSYYTTLFFKDDKSKDLCIDTNIFRDEEVPHADLFDRKDVISDKKTKIPGRNLKTLALQLIAYLYTPKADVAPNPQMKSTYHPNNTIKNKFREVYIQDIGVRIGATLKQKEREVIEAYKKTDEYKNSSEARHHKSPVPHYRKAHWHGYWTGKGRAKWELKWIEPTFVCGSISSVTIHKVKDED